MPVVLTDLRDIAHLGVDEVIDVRAPAEFAEDHIPGALSLPVLSDAERARVGEIYVQQDSFLARKIGAALVARNAARHLEEVLHDRPGAWRPLVYCWRGGQRSGSFVSILQQIGWRAEVLEGGYRAYRRLVVGALYDAALPNPAVVIDGGTGTGKTLLLAHLERAGAQVLDLEALAGHRGSLFGAEAGGQPSQKAFESRLAQALARFDPARPVYLEAESPRLGRLNLPPAITAAVKAGTRVRLSVPMAARVAHIRDGYADLIADPARLDALLGALARFHGHDRVAQWRGLAAEGAFGTLITALIETHYDPRYRRMTREGEEAEHALPDLSAPSLAACAAALIGRFG